MPAWKTICCAVDFSQSSRLALEEAADLARRFAAELILVHVYQAPRAASETLFVSPPAIYEELMGEAEKKLEAWRRDAEHLAGLKVTAVMPSGHAAEEILRFARERSVDLIVLGTHGRRGVRHFVVGSVAEQVVRQACATVLVARAPRPSGRG